MHTVLIIQLSKVKTCLFKVHPKKSVIIYSPLCRPKLLRLSFIFKTQIKIFLMKSEISVLPLTAVQLPF